MKAQGKLPFLVIERRKFVPIRSQHDDTIYGKLLRGNGIVVFLALVRILVSMYQNL